MTRLLVVHWKPEEAAEGLALLEQAGHGVEIYSAPGGAGMARFREEVPDVLLISLERLPSHGREAARWFRTTKATRSVPIAACSTKPLWQKLELREGDRVFQWGGPADLRHILGDGLPDGISITRRTSSDAKIPKRIDLILLFAQRISDLEDRFPIASAATPLKRPLWLCWPKKTSGVETDVTQAAVMELGRSNNWTDTKICRVDESWSGHMFRRKR